MTNFAKGLVSGTIKAPAKTSWWPRHVRALMDVLPLSVPKVFGSSRWTKLGEVAQEWETLCPKAARHELMIEHSLLEVSLINAVRKNDVKEIEKLGQQLYENATESAAVLGIAIPQFPEAHFKKLFCDHVALYAGLIRKTKEGVKVDGRDMESNTLVLADLTAEWL